MANVITPADVPSEPNGLPPAALYPLRELGGEFLADIGVAHEARTSGKALGAITGLAALDRQLSQRLAQGIHIIHGNSGVGKTALMLQIAQDCGAPCLFVTCEMPPVEILRRIIARQCGVFLNKLKDGTMPPERAKVLLSEALANVPNLYILDVTQSPAPPAEIIDRVKIIRSRLPQEKHFLLAIDSLQTYTQVMTGGTEVSEYEALNAAIRALQVVAHKVGQPLLITSERNRASAKQGGLNAGAGTRKIEYQSETVFSLGTEGDAPQPNGLYSKAISLDIAKNRHGLTTRGYWLEFDGARQSFTELSVPESMQETGGDY